MESKIALASEMKNRRMMGDNHSAKESADEESIDSSSAFPFHYPNAISQKSIFAPQ